MPDAMSGYKKEQLAMFWCKMEPEDEEPSLTIQIVCNKTPFFFYAIVCN